MITKIDHSVAIVLIPGVYVAFDFDDEFGVVVQVNSTKQNRPQEVRSYFGDTYIRSFVPHLTPGVDEFKGKIPQIHFRRLKPAKYGYLESLFRKAHSLEQRRLLREINESFLDVMRRYLGS